MSENRFNFQKLTPVNNIDLNVYEDAIDYIFDNHDIKNVAITGSFGAGKSSVLETYKEKHKNIKFAHILLAHFKPTDSRSDNKPKEEGKSETGVKESVLKGKSETGVKESVLKGKSESEVKESVLEGKILNQLIHQISADRIPQTNFKVKKKVLRKNIWIGTILTVLFILAILHIFLFDSWRSYVSSLPYDRFASILNLSIEKYSLFVSGLICAAIFGFCIYSIIKVQNYKNIFKKITFQNSSIEIFEESEESYFDKYLNEVLYLFENIDAQVIVFEDLDRFNANSIFERLREINTLANIQLQKENKLLRFFYLIRDDIFISKDRTKFFDYIIPIVPVVDSSNSYDQFITHFKEGNILDFFDESFLQGLSLYIDDMRILKNLYNEFIIYFNRLNITELDSNKMLAMISYKNLFPRDFSDLQLNKGFVFTVFNKKQEHIKAEIEKLKANIAELDAQIVYAKKEHLESERELVVAYDDKRNRLSPYSPESNILRQKYNDEESKRKEAIQNNLNNRLTEMEKELVNKKQKLSELGSKQLKEIISRDNVETVFKVTATNEIGDTRDFNEVKSNEYFDLLKYLVSNGYIDEDYPDYMTYFYENSLSRIDQTYLRSITDRKAKGYTFQLKNLRLVVNRLRLVDFDQPEVLNFNLLEYLLQTPENNDLLNRFLKQLKQTKNYKFISAYFDTNREFPVCVNKLNLQWPEIFSEMIISHLFSEIQLRQYIINTLYYSDDISVKNLNIDKCVTNYISSSADFLNINEPLLIDKLIHGFLLLDVSFKSIDYDLSNKTLFEAIYMNSLYEISFNNLKLVLQKVHKIKNQDDIQHKNYSLIYSLQGTPLKQYIEENISNYIDVVLENCSGEIFDDEKAILNILNNEEIILEQKISYLELLKTTLSTIEGIKEKTLWSTLLSKKLVSYTEENIVDYYINNKIDTILINFINCNELKLDFAKITGIYEDDFIKDFFNDCIRCNDLSNIKYREILTTIGLSNESFNFLELSAEKISIIIEEKVISMNLATLKFMRDNYPDQTFSFIQNNIEEYADLIAKESFELDELIEILTWDIDDDIKIKLLGFTSEQLSILGKKYSSTIICYILNNNLDTSELAELFSTYETWDHSIQDIIFELSLKYNAQLNWTLNTVSIELIRRIFTTNNLDYSLKIDLLISLLPRLNDNTCKEYFSLLDLNEYVKFFEKYGRPKLEVNDINNRLLTAFRDSNRIQDFQIDTDKPNYYKIIRFRAISKTLPTELL